MTSQKYEPRFTFLLFPTFKEEKVPKAHSKTRFWNFLRPKYFTLNSQELFDTGLLASLPLGLFIIYTTQPGKGGGDGWLVELSKI